MTDVMVVYWEWTEDSPHSGARFWGCHSIANDGRLEDWPKIGLRPLATALVTIEEGKGLELLASNQGSASHG